MGGPEMGLARGSPLSEHVVVTVEETLLTKYELDVGKLSMTHLHRIERSRSLCSRDLVGVTARLGSWSTVWPMGTAYVHPGDPASSAL